MEERSYSEEWTTQLVDMIFDRIRLPSGDSTLIEDNLLLEGLALVPSS